METVKNSLVVVNMDTENEICLVSLTKLEPANLNILPEELLKLC